MLSKFKANIGVNPITIQEILYGLGFQDILAWNLRCFYPPALWANFCSGVLADVAKHFLGLQIYRCHPTKFEVLNSSRVFCDLDLFRWLKKKCAKKTLTKRQRTDPLRDFLFRNRRHPSTAHEPLLCFMALILGPPIIGCTKAYLEFANAGRPHHGYWVVPRIWWAQPFLTTPCAGPEKKHYYRCGAHVAILVNGTYVRAVFSRVEEDIFPPRAEFSFVTDSPTRTCEHQRLLEVETGLISRTCLLSVQDMYDGQHCQVAPEEFVGFAPATLEEVKQNLRTQVSPAPVSPEPEPPGGGSCRIA